MFEAQEVVQKYKSGKEKPRNEASPGGWLLEEPVIFGEYTAQYALSNLYTILNHSYKEKHQCIKVTKVKTLIITPCLVC